MEQRIELLGRLRELGLLAVRAHEIAGQASSLLVQVSDLEVAARRCAAEGRIDASRELLEQANALRASAATLAEPYAALRAQASSQLRDLEMELDLGSFRLVLDKEFRELVNRQLAGVRSWLEDDRTVFGSAGVLGDLPREQYAADDPGD